MVNQNSITPKLKLTKPQFEALIDWSHKRINSIVCQHIYGDGLATREAKAEEFVASDKLYEVLALQPGEYNASSMIEAIRAGLNCLDSEFIDDEEFSTIVRNIVNVRD